MLKIFLSYSKISGAIAQAIPNVLIY